MVIDVGYASARNHSLSRVVHFSSLSHASHREPPLLQYHALLDKVKLINIKGIKCIFHKGKVNLPSGYNKAAI